MINHPLEDREGSRRPPAGGVACGGSLGTEAFRVVGPCGVWKEEGLQRDDHSVGVLLDPRQLGYRQVSGPLVSLWRALWKGQGYEVTGRTVLSQWLW